jgi:hypothetical protein
MRKLAPFLLVVLLGALGWAFASILSIRFGGGEVYPPGSSLRVDRLGSRILYDSVARLRPADRNFGQIDGTDLHGVTVLILHTNPAQIEEGSWQSFTNRGARLILAFTPVPIQRVKRELEGLDMTLTYSPPTEEMKDTPAWEAGRETTLSMVPGAAWTVIRQGQIAERAFGKGSLVMVSNADIFSNQTLAEVRSADLLARVIGPAERVVFDEAHFGIRDNPGVMVLVRRYGLTGLLFAMIVLAALFVWQAAFPLVPLAAQGSELLELQSERTSESGLAQLLRRGIKPSELIQVCAREWERIASYTPAQRNAVRLALSESPDPATAFARATLALERKR